MILLITLLFLVRLEADLYAISLDQILFVLLLRGINYHLWTKCLRGPMKRSGLVFLRLECREEQDHCYLRKLAENLDKHSKWLNLPKPSNIIIWRDQVCFRLIFCFSPGSHGLSPLCIKLTRRSNKLRWFLQYPIDAKCHHYNPSHLHLYN